MTPLPIGHEVGRLDLEIVRHPGGAASSWVETAQIGTQAAVSGPGYVLAAAPPNRLSGHPLRGELRHPRRMPPAL